MNFYFNGNLVEGEFAVSVASFATQQNRVLGNFASVAPPSSGLLLLMCDRLGKARFRRITHLTLRDRRPEESPWSAYLRHNRTSVTIESGSLSDIPMTGPVFLVANHPTGFPDGPAIGHLLGQVRQDFKMMAARQFMDLPLAPDILPMAIDGQLGSGPDDTARFNASSFRQAHRWMKKGGALTAFPAGAGHGAKVRLGPLGRLVDATWSDNVFRLARKAFATIVPVRIHNEPGFVRRALHRVSRDHYQFARLAEVDRAAGSTHKVSILPPWRPEHYADYGDQQLAEVLRCQCAGIASPLIPGLASPDCASNGIVAGANSAGPPQRYCLSAATQ